MWSARRCSLTTTSSTRWPRRRRPAARGARPASRGRPASRAGSPATRQPSVANGSPGRSAKRGLCSDRVDPGRRQQGDLVVGRLDGRVVEPRGVDGGVPELRTGRQRPHEAGVGGEPEDAGAVEGVDQAGAGGLAVRAPGDDLAQHRVEGRADHLAGLEGGVDADPARCRPRSTTYGALGEGGRRPAHQLGGAGLRQEPAEGVLGVDPGLDRVPLDGDVLLREAERLAGGHAELQLDQVDALAADPHDLLGDGVLDLEAGVHLEEVDVARVAVEQELDRAGVGVADRLRQGDGAAGDRRRAGPR